MPYARILSRRLGYYQYIFFPLIPFGSTEVSRVLRFDLSVLSRGVAVSDADGFCAR